MKKKKPKPIPKYATKITKGREYKYGDRVYVKVANNEKFLKGKVLGLSNQPDIYNWYIVKLLKFSPNESYTTAPHHNLSLRKKVKK